MFRRRLAMFFLAAAALWAQSYSGSLTGVIYDPVNTAIPGARVTLTDVAKGYEFPVTTDVNGRYLVRNLPPGKYKLTAAAEGFGLYVQDGIVLSVNQHASIDVTLQLRSVSERVDVRSEAPLLATQDAYLGQVIDRKFINDLPLVGRSVLNLAYLAPGVTPAAGRAYSTGGDVNFISNGGRNASAGVITDGVTTTGPDPNPGIVRVQYTPSVDAVQEFKIEQNNFRADVGFSGATSINIVTRSGGNQFHGTLYEFGQNSALNANNWFSNRSGAAKPATLNHTFGGVVGGPIRRDKTFFFAVYNGGRSRNSSATSAGVPSEAMRNGDFREMCPQGFNSSGLCANANGQLWDPYSAAYDARYGGPVRTAYIPFNNLSTYMSPGPPPGTGSAISLPRRPGNLVDPAAAKMFQYFPKPNLNVGTPLYNRFYNYFGTSKGRGAGNETNVRIDHRFTDRDLLMGKYTHNWGNSNPARCYDSIMDPCSNGPGTSMSEHLSLNFNRMVSPATVFTVNLGFVRNRTNSNGATALFPEFNPVKDLGMPEYILRQGKIAAPYVSYGGGYVLGTFGTKNSSLWNMHFQNYQLAPSVDMIRGRHDLKFGGESRLHRLNHFQPAIPAGRYNYNFNASSQYPTTGGGDALASFLMGLGTGDYLINPALSAQNADHALYIHDKWRISSRLTINLGLRWEVPLPGTERFDRLGWFDVDAESPLKATGLGVLRGGMRFAGGDTRAAYNTPWNNWGPRASLAYRLGSKTVVRAGYGMFYAVSMANASGVGEVFTAWNQRTNIQQYAENGATPYARFSDPYPFGGPMYPPGSSEGLMTLVGLQVESVLREWSQTPQIQTWSLGFQHELPGLMVASVNYVGTKGTHLNFGTRSMKSLDSWVEGLTLDEIAQLNAYVPNPFYRVITNPSSTLRYSTIQRFQLMRPFPQFSGLSTYVTPWADSSYHSLQLQIEKRFAHGLQAQGAYTWSKSIDNASVVSGGTQYLGGSQVTPQNPNNLRLERSLSQYDVPHSLKIAYTYELPWGRGKPLGRNWNAWLNAVVGGWVTTGIWYFQSGYPLMLGLQGGQSPITYGPQRPNLVEPLRRNTGPDWMSNYFANPGAAVRPARYALGNAPRTLPVRSPGAATNTLAVFKQVPLGGVREGMKLEIRAESFNALNHPQFGGPNTTVGTPSLGLVTSQANSPRAVQLGAKLYW